MNDYVLRIAAWAPYFDDMKSVRISACVFVHCWNRILHSVILFLVPISCFDQMLAEDPTVNRLVSK